MLWKALFPIQNSKQACHGNAEIIIIIRVAECQYIRKSQGHSQYRLPKSLKVVSVYIKVDAGDYSNVSLHLACLHI
jgi:hypothetical protein